ncbi:MAG: LytTR family transcriptional regulator DNA-binding domain-containing protein [Lachnospiraceae bacterium]|nr:LytTR family transcriptional regulator DNA-binding domain-containing protein [Lachnospiraceae bacterium]
MRVIYETPDPEEEDVIIVRCSSPDERLISMLKTYETSQAGLTGYLEDKIVPIKLQDVFYFEANENRVFAYCDSEVYEIKYKLYELEELFGAGDFLRCSKSMILNMEKIEFLSPHFNGKLEAHLVNGERILISRQYVRDLKAKLSLGKEG